MRALLAWLLFAIGAIFIGFDIGMLRMTGLALLGVLLLVGWALLIGAHRASFWVTDDIDPEDRSRLDLAGKGRDR